MNIFIDVKKEFPSFSFSLKYDSNARITSLLGPSGSGKSVFLKIISGIIKPDEGIVKINDRVLFDSSKKINVPPQKRRVGYLFQNYALFPTMNVYKNMTIALKGMSKKEKDGKAHEVAKMLKIEHLLSRMPELLSGGEKQRVALARLLLTNPDIILLDEPFSALDVALRNTLRIEMKSLIEQSGKSAILVTHDMDEAFFMSSYTYLIKNGNLVEKGDNETLYYKPRTLEGAKLLSIKNIFGVIDGCVSDLNIHIQTKCPYVAIRDSSFSLDNGDFNVNVNIQSIEESLDLSRYQMKTESGKIISASFEKGARVGNRIFFNKEDLIELY